MKDKIYNYLLGELYPSPSCDTCQYSDIDAKRVPCNKCDGAYSQYKLHGGHQADLKSLTKGIVKIIKTSK